MTSNPTYPDGAEQPAAKAIPMNHEQNPELPSVNLDAAGANTQLRFGHVR
jgi:hypothetical protein